MAFHTQIDRRQLHQRNLDIAADIVESLSHEIPTDINQILFVLRTIHKLQERERWEIIKILNESKLVEIADEYGSQKYYLKPKYPVINFPHSIIADRRR